MKDSVVLTTITCELNKFQNVVESGKQSEIADHICERLLETDAEITILNKIYDVMFFYFGGSHLEKNPIKIADYMLFARRIKLAIDKPEGIIGELLIEINDTKSIINQKQIELYDLHKQEEAMVKKLQSICGHLEFKQEQLYYEDEYGSTHYGNMMRQCKVCGLREEAKSNRPWIDERGEYSFKIILGPEPKPAKIKMKS